MKQNLYHNIRMHARICQVIRQNFISDDFVEIDPPILLRTNLPETYVDPIYLTETDETVAHAVTQLQTSPESYMKKILGQCPELKNIFALTHVFRNDPPSEYHLIEFLMLEWYRVGGTLADIADDFDHLRDNISTAVQNETAHSNATGKAIHMSLSEAFHRYTKVNLFDFISSEDVQLDDLLVKLKPANLALPSAPTLSDIVDCVIDTVLCQDELMMKQPVVVHDWPIQMGALARQNPDVPAYAERIEIYWRGLELLNAFNELTCPDEQRDRFLKANEERRLRDKNTLPIDTHFLAALGPMSTTVGAALGIDRLLMAICERSNIRTARHF